MIDIVSHICKHNPEIVLPVCATLNTDSDPLAKEVLVQHFPAGIVKTTENIAAGEFQIKSSTSGSCMYLKESTKQNSQTQRWSSKYGRVMNSAKVGKNFYVFTGQPENSEENALWQLSFVKDSKYF